MSNLHLRPHLTPISVNQPTNQNDPKSIRRCLKTDRKAPLLRIAVINSTPMPFRAQLLVKSTRTDHLPRHQLAVDIFRIFKDFQAVGRTEEFWSYFLPVFEVRQEKDVWKIVALGERFGER